MTKRILIVGGVAGGASVAARVRRLDEQAEVIVFERGPYPSFSNCALPNFLSRDIEDSEEFVGSEEIDDLHRSFEEVKQDLSQVKMW